MNRPVLVALIVAIGPTLVGVATLVTSYNNSRKADVQAVKLEEVHTLTNSAMTGLRNALDTANNRIISLEKILATMTAHGAAADTLKK